MLVVTMLALHPHEPVFQATIFKVIRKFLLHIHQQGLALHDQHISEFQTVWLNDLVMKCPFRLVAMVWLAKW
jgi:hypothetical protein